MKIKVVLVDDHRLLREGLRKILEGDASLSVVGKLTTVKLQ
jgi:DNA-binding NarL/FixJ family response regulator